MDINEILEKIHSDTENFAGITAPIIPTVYIRLVKTSNITATALFID